MNGESCLELRIGQGIDVHRFQVGRPLVLGNVNIPSDIGLEGHSDADVLLHAIMDALLGATGKPDIGYFFPNTNPLYKDINSGELFDVVWAGVVKDGWSLVNVDCTILAERPKLMPHFSSIRKRIAELFSADPERIGLKATTAEGLGFVGRSEGIFASAVVLLSR